MQPQKIIYDPEYVFSSKYYDLDEMHNAGIPNKSKSASVSYKCMFSFKKLLIFYILWVAQNN